VSTFVLKVEKFVYWLLTFNAVVDKSASKRGDKSIYWSSTFNVNRGQFCLH